VVFDDISMKPESAFAGQRRLAGSRQDIIRALGTTVRPDQDRRQRAASRQDAADYVRTAGHGEEEQLAGAVGRWLTRSARRGGVRQP
jgi:hypothetical protein